MTSPPTTDEIDHQQRWLHGGVYYREDGPVLYRPIRGAAWMTWKHFNQVRRTVRINARTDLPENIENDA